MGCVFRARQSQLARVVALKILPESLAVDPKFAKRFTREARALASLNHPNIVTVHDFGRAGEFYYLLMEHVDGVNLRQALRAGRFTPEQALAIVPPLCDALQYAHDRRGLGLFLGAVLAVLLGSLTSGLTLLLATRRRSEPSPRGARTG